MAEEGVGRVDVEVLLLHEELDEWFVAAGGGPVERAEAGVGLGCAVVEVWGEEVGEAAAGEEEGGGVFGESEVFSDYEEELVGEGEEGHFC